MLFLDRYASQILEPLRALITYRRFLITSPTPSFTAPKNYSQNAGRRKELNLV